jgi:GNAT superfamily N-acetyltransferase
MATWEIVPLVERSDLLAGMWELTSTWPPFMLKDPIGNRLFPKVPELFPEYQLLALDDDGHVAGRLIAAPFPYDGNLQSLPDRGWDAVLEQAVEEHGQRPPTAVCLLEARIAPAAQGQGLSHKLLAAARSHVSALGYRDLFGPVRPTAKADEPHTPMGDYVRRLRADGLPSDPWLRVHVRLGGQIVKVCPTSMTVPGTLAEWRAWTGLGLTTSGPHDVPGALVPIHVSVEHDHCVYVEPNVWIHHRLDPQSLRRPASLG